MDESEVYDVIVKALSDMLSTDEEDILPDDDIFEDLGADMYDMIELEFIIEEEFGKKLDLQKESELTVASLAAMIEE